MVTGHILRVETEWAEDPASIDHVYIWVDAGIGFPIQLAVNTFSIKCRDAGCDPEVRVGRISKPFTHRPHLGVEVHPGLDYGHLESKHNVFYEKPGKPALEKLLHELCHAHPLVQAWGMPFVRKWAGLHQIHCRRASSVVHKDLHGHDGALKFYPSSLQEEWTLLLLKFHGQP